jgi:hypothetical protein
VIIRGAVNDIAVEVVRRNPADVCKGCVPQPKRWVVEQVNGTLMLHRRLTRDYDHRRDNAASRVNVHELLRLLQTEHGESAARADNLRQQIEQFTTTLAEPEARLAEPAATRKDLGLPTDEPSLHVTRSRRGRLVRQGLLEQPGRGQYRKRTPAPSQWRENRVPESVRPSGAA